MSLEVAIEQLHTNIYVVKPNGSIDSETHVKFKQSLNPILDMNPKVIVFDMADVSYITSMGLSAIINTKKVMERKDGKVFLTDFQTSVKKVFEMVKAIPHESIFFDMKELEDHLKTSGEVTDS